MSVTECSLIFCLLTKVCGAGAGVGVGFCCPTPSTDVQLDNFLYHTPELEIPVEMVQFLSKLLLK